MDFLMTGLFARYDLQKRHIFKPPRKCQESCLMELLRVPGEEPRRGRQEPFLVCAGESIFL